VCGMRGYARTLTPWLAAGSLNLAARAQGVFAGEQPGVRHASYPVSASLELSIALDAVPAR
jgi:hypothetical protein